MAKRLGIVLLFTGILAGLAVLIAMRTSSPAREADERPAVHREREAAPANPTPSLHSNDPLALTIERTAAYLAARPLMDDAYWISKRTAHLLGGEFAGWKEVLTREERRIDPALLGYPPEAVAAWLDSYDRPMPPLAFLPRPENLAPLPTPQDFDDENLRHVILVTIMGLRCTVACEPDNMEALVADVAEPGTDYVLTHQLLALMLAYQFACIPPEEFEPLRERLAIGVYRELLGDTTFTDLTAERMAMLAFAGLTDWIPESHLAMAMATQQPNGSWPVRLVFGPDSVVTSPPEHTASLALFALAHVWLGQRAGPE